MRLKWFMLVVTIEQVFQVAFLSCWQAVRGACRRSQPNTCIHAHFWVGMMVACY
jgi:hypothetical protein